MQTHQDFMLEALKLAQKAEKKNEVPIGALLVYNNQIISTGYNRPIFNCDPTAHAEIIALRKAAKKLNNYRLPNTILYVTLEPCLMCLGAIIHARISQIVFGAKDLICGAVRRYPHKINYTDNILEQDCSKLLKNFFEKRR